jgi:hypothetical protein
MPETKPPRKPHLVFSEVDLDAVDRLRKQMAELRKAKQERAALKDKDLH